MKPVFSKKVDLVLWLTLLMITTLSALVNKISELNHSEITLKVKEKNFAAEFFYQDSVRPVIQSFKPNIKIRSQPELKIDNANLLLKLFAPNDFFASDIIYSLPILIICILFLFTLKNLDFTKAFPPKLAYTIQISGVVCLIFWGIDLIRAYLINKHVLDITNELYVLKSGHIFILPEFYLGIGLIVLSHLLKKGEQIQAENELTVQMPIVVNLDVMLAKRKMSLTELSEKVNITMANLSILKTSKAKAIRFSTLEDICKVLECQPGDLLEYMNDKDYKKLMGL